MTVSSCYNTGKISGKNLSYTGAFTTGSSDTAENSFYLAGSIPTGAKTNDATPISDGAELLEQLEQFIKEQDTAYSCIIKVEQSYTAAHK